MRGSIFFSVGTRKVFLLIAVLLLGSAAPASAAVLRDVRVVEKPGRVDVVFELNRAVKYRVTQKLRQRLVKIELESTILKDSLPRRHLFRSSLASGVLLAEDAHEATVARLRVKTGRLKVTHSSGRSPASVTISLISPDAPRQTAPPKPPEPKPQAAPAKQQPAPPATAKPAASAPPQASAAPQPPGRLGAPIDLEKDVFGDKLARLERETRGLKILRRDERATELQERNRLIREDLDILNKMGEKRFRFQPTASHLRREHEKPPAAGGPQADLYAQARKSYSAGKNDEAATLYQNIIAKLSPKPAAENAMYRLGAVYQAMARTRGENKHYLAMVQAYRQALRTYPHSALAPLALYRVVAGNLKVNLLLEAQAALRELERRFPKAEHTAMAALDVAENLLKQNDFEAGREILRRIITHYPGTELMQRAYLRLAVSYADEGEFPVAGAMVKEGWRRWPDLMKFNPPLLFQVGYVLWQVPDYETAAEVFSTYYNLYPEGEDAPMALAYMGDSLYAGPKKDLGIKVLQGAVKKYPDTPAGRLARIRLAEPDLKGASEVGRNQALKVLQSAADEREKQGKDVASLALDRLLGMSLEEGDYKKALAQAAELKRRDPRSKFSREAEARLTELITKYLQEQVAQGEYLLAVDGYLAYWSGPLLPEHAPMLVESYRNLGLYRQVEKVLAALGRKELAKLPPGFADRYMGEVYLRRGLFEKAAAALEPLVSATPPSPYLSEVNLLLADLYFRQGKYAKTHKILLEAIDVKKPAASREVLYHWLGNVLMRKEDFAEAAWAYRNVLRLAQERGEKGQPPPDHVVDSYFSVADALFRAEKFEEARRAYREAAAAVPTDPRVARSGFMAALSSERGADPQAAGAEYKAVGEKQAGAFWGGVNTAMSESLALQEDYQKMRRAWRDRQAR